MCSSQTIFLTLKILHWYTKLIKLGLVQFDSVRFWVIVLFWTRLLQFDFSLNDTEDHLLLAFWCVSRQNRRSSLGRITKPWSSNSGVATMELRMNLNSFLDHRLTSILFPLHLFLVNNRSAIRFFIAFTCYFIPTFGSLVQFSNLLRLTQVLICGCVRTSIHCCLACWDDFFMLNLMALCNCLVNN